MKTGPEGTFAYSPRGTLASVDGPGGLVTYDFDSLGRLVDYNSEVTYTYDGLGRVAARGGVAFTYEGGSLDPVSDGTFTYGRSPSGRLVSQTDGVTSLLAGLDAHGDLGFLYSAAGVVSDTALFDPFGDPVAATGSTSPTLGFQADFTDPASEHVWMGSRWYDGGWAAFLSRDTVFGELRTPVSLNRYTYAFANPISFFDPDGRTSQATKCTTIEGQCAGSVIEEDGTNVTQEGPPSQQDLETIEATQNTSDRCNAAGFCESEDMGDGSTPDTASEEADAALEELEGRGGVFVPPEMMPHQQFIGFVLSSSSASAPVEGRPSTLIGLDCLVRRSRVWSWHRISRQ